MYGRSDGRGEVLDQFSFISIIWPQFQKWCQVPGHSEEQETGPSGELENSSWIPAHRDPSTTCVNAMTPQGKEVLWERRGGSSLFVWWCWGTFPGRSHTGRF